jgi:hypothetical protein
MEEEKNDHFNILINELEDNKELCINLPELNLRINIDNEEDNVILQMYTENYNISIISDCSPIYMKIEESRFKKGMLKDCLNYLNSLFREDGTLRYSKLTDKVYKNEILFTYYEKLEIAKLTITKQKENCICSVCKEFNTVLTSCQHNLCRYCYVKISKTNTCCEDNCSPILCPICRESISS